MGLKLRHSFRSSRRLVIGICLMLFVVTVAADGPVNIVAGVSITSDTNDAEGEQWGRPGGRTIVYSVGDVSGFDTLTFGATSLPTAAFDNAVNAPGETMVFDGTSNLANGQARWTGSAFLPLAGGQALPSQVVQTRFTMTIKNASNTGVAMTNFNGGPTPGIDVKSVGSSFSVNLIFEALAPAGFAGAGTWVPFLDFYDAAPTVDNGNPPGSGGPALTGFSRGFFFANQGLTLEEHDATMTAQFNALSGAINSVKNDTSFTKAEVTGGLQGLAGTLGEVRDNVVMTIKPNVQQIQGTTGQIQNRVNEIFNIVSSSPQNQNLATKTDVSDAKNSLTDILMILIGLKPCPLSAAECASLTFMPQVARQANLLEVQQAINALPTQANVQQVLQALSGLATNGDVDEVKDALNTLATQMSVEQVKQSLIDLAAAVDAINASIATPAKSLEVQVVETSDSASGKKRRWLVRTSVAGAPAAAQLTGLVAITQSKNSPSVATQVLQAASVTQLMPGMMEVVLEASEGKLNDLAFNFSVSHSSPGGSLTAGILIGLLR